ncbi:uncharacterized protein LOC119286239 isoform X2 [Triticum dicoccoides]|uniref:uncharacterized protein LOC119286239 isoform X2 n=1 Tax=Triticum dicoccoides TaxID=85692 RepID=UPI00188E1CA2|nr:uncharacterized protein LOC119286239 isoform X2 [Triticum dicoccoides]
MEPSHPARSSACCHQSPPATHPAWLGFQASDLVSVAMSSSFPPMCGEERAVDNLAATRDEAATSFLLLRLQGVEASNCGDLQLWSPPAAPHNQSSKQLCWTAASSQP